MENWGETTSMKAQENFYHKFDNYKFARKIITYSIDNIPEPIKIYLQDSLFEVFLSAPAI